MLPAKLSHASPHANTQRTLRHVVCCALSLITCAALSADARVAPATHELGNQTSSSPPMSLMHIAPAYSPLTEELKRLTRGLTYLSESDFPVEPFFMVGQGQKIITPDDLPTAKKPVQEGDFDAFFANAIADQDWHGPEDRETAARFRALVKLLKENLTNIKVYRAGEIEIDVFVVGRTAEGDFAGITTKVIET